LLVALRSAQEDETAAATVEDRHSLPSAVVAAVVAGVADADAVGEEVAASNDRAAAGEFVRLAHSVSAAVEEALALYAQDWETRMRSHGPVLSVAILLVVGELAAELAASAHCAAAVVLIVRAALLRRRLAGLLENRTEWISAPESVSHLPNMDTLASAQSGA
jgi:hypothetical protein